MNENDFKGHGLIYLKATNEVQEIALMETLIKLRVSATIVNSIQDLLLKSKTGEYGLLITDMFDNIAEFQKTIMSHFPNTYIVCINEQAMGKKILKGNHFIKDMETLLETIQYLKSGAGESGHFNSRVFTEKKELKMEGNDQVVNNVPIEKTEEQSPNQEMKEEINKSVPLPVDSKSDMHTEEQTDLSECSETSVEESESEESEGGSVQYEENAYFKRSRNLQKQLFAKQKWEENRMIGIWSPLHRTGVTSLTMDFAFYLAQNRIYTAVLEGLTEQHAMKDRLKRFTHVPTNWESYARAIQTDSVANHSDWTYRNVTFLPLNKEDSKYEWNSMSLESYMTTTKIVDVTLVDLPTGKMASYTTDTLHYLDELWIVVDDAIQETLAWKAYIREIEKNVEIPISLIFNKTFSFSQSKRMGKELDLPIIATMPSLHEETMKNYYQNTPLYFQSEVQEKVAKSFFDLANHLFAGKFEVKQRVQVQNKNTWFEKILKPLKG